jgi:hypothetical protein
MSSLKPLSQPPALPPLHSTPTHISAMSTAMGGPGQPSLHLPPYPTPPTQIPLSQRATAPCTAQAKPSQVQSPPDSDPGLRPAPQPKPHSVTTRKSPNACLLFFFSAYAFALRLSSLHYSQLAEVFWVSLNTMVYTTSWPGLGRSILDKVLCERGILSSYVEKLVRRKGKQVELNEKLSIGVPGLSL